MNTLGHLINGQLVTDAKRTQDVYNPATGAVAAQVALASAQTVESAIAAQTPTSLIVAILERLSCQGFCMSKTRVTPPGGKVFRPRPRLSNVVPWVAFAGLPLLLAIYLIDSEQGSAALISNAYLHEFAHDGRHSLGLSCH